MSRYYVKSKRMYEKPVLFDETLLLAAIRKSSKGRRRPTSIALEDQTIRELKDIAEKKGLPYQVLMRMFILDGLRRFKEAA